MLLSLARFFFVATRPRQGPGPLSFTNRAHPSPPTGQVVMTTSQLSECRDVWTAYAYHRDAPVTPLPSDRHAYIILTKASPPPPPPLFRLHAVLFLSKGGPLSTRIDP